MKSEIKGMYIAVLKYGKTVQGYYDYIDQLQSVSAWPDNTSIFYQYSVLLKRFMKAGK